MLKIIVITFFFSVPGNSLTETKTEIMVLTPMSCDEFVKETGGRIVEDLMSRQTTPTRDQIDRFTIECTQPFDNSKGGLQ